jgi:hypothetical protein
VRDEVETGRTWVLWGRQQVYATEGNASTTDVKAKVWRAKAFVPAAHLSSRLCVW